MSKNVFCFDLDGTLAELDTAYLALIKSNPKNWKAFNHHIIDDNPIRPTLIIGKALSKDDNNIILIVTARGHDAKENTLNWLGKINFKYEKLYMRSDGDTRPDRIVKKEMVDQILDTYGNICAFFDDRKQVLEMLHENNIWTYDCSQGAIY